MINQKYKELLENIINNGIQKGDRTGTGTISLFGTNIEHHMSDGFPLLTTKKMAWKAIVTELLWFLRGETNIKYLHDNGCHIWDGDCYKYFVTKMEKEGIEPLSQERFVEMLQTDPKFLRKWGDMGPIYGKQWRKWESAFDDLGDYRGEEIDQISNVIQLLETDPDSRRMIVNAWNVGELDMMKLPPCHYTFQFWTRELTKHERLARLIGPEAHRLPEDSISEEFLEKKGSPKRAISLMWNQRSVDTFLGLPFNIASYGLLLHIIAAKVNMLPSSIKGTLGDTHIYSNHTDQVNEQIRRDVDKYPLPKVMMSASFLEILKTEPFTTAIMKATPDDFVLDGYQSFPGIKAPLSN